MGGYTPLFDSILNGSLYGRFPDLYVWMVMLSMADSHGNVDAHPRVIAAAAGIDEGLVREAIARFCDPDPDSRTPDQEGRRAVPIPGAGFGWHLINHAKYREKARLAAKNAREVAEGKNAARMADRREPPVTAGDPLSNSYSNPNLNQDEEEDPTAAARPTDEPEGFAKFWEAYPKRAGDNPRHRAVKAYRARIKAGAREKDILAGTLRYIAFLRAAGKVGTEFVMQAATFVGPDRRYEDAWSPAPTKAQIQQDANVAASLQWLESSNAG